MLLILSPLTIGTEEEEERRQENKNTREHNAR
jgi:hypothetical protein